MENHVLPCLQKNVTIIHTHTDYLLSQGYLRRVDFTVADLFSIELHDPSLPLSIYYDYHVVSGCYIDYILEVADLVESAFMIAEELAWFLGKNHEVVVTRSAFEDLVTDGDLLWEGVGFLVVLAEEVVVVACVRREIRPQMYIIVKF